MPLLTAPCAAISISWWNMFEYFDHAGWLRRKHLPQHREEVGHIVADGFDIGEFHQGAPVRHRIAEVLEAIEMDRELGDIAIRCVRNEDGGHEAGRVEAVGCTNK